MNPDRRNHDLWCYFHNNHWHLTGDCNHLKAEVAQLLRVGHLKKILNDWSKHILSRNHNSEEPRKLPSPIQKTPHDFRWGSGKRCHLFSLKKTKVFISSGKGDREFPKHHTITYSSKDCNGLSYAHNDPMVTALRVLNSKIKLLLIDLGSLANIIQLQVKERYF